MIEWKSWEKDPPKAEDGNTGYGGMVLSTYALHPWRCDPKPTFMMRRYDSVWPHNGLWWCRTQDVIDNSAFTGEPR